MKLPTSRITLACALLASYSGSLKTEPVKLTSTAITLTDGTFIRSQEFALMLTIRRDIINILVGTLVNKERIGSYVLDNKHYNLQELAVLEQEYKNNNNSDGLTKLQHLLTEAKADLWSNLSRYTALAQGAKGSMLILINESCKKHGKKHSVLQNWGATPDGEEEEQMARDLTSLAICAEFCSDLINFLEDMIYSCEKAREQYKKEMAERLNSKAEKL